MTKNDNISMIPKEGLLRVSQVLQLIPVGKSTWWSGIKSGIYPSGHKLSVGVTAWRAEDIWNLVEQFPTQIL